MKKLILHMGFHKTASSSFQRSCWIGRGQLEKLGYYYPEFIHCETNHRFKANHGPVIISLLHKNPETYYGNIVLKTQDIKAVNDAYKSQLNAILDHPADVIISGEGISTLNLTQLKTLQSWIHDSGREIIPLCLVRSPYDFHCSALQQEVKHGNHIDFKILHTQHAKISAIKTAFPNTQFAPFKESCNHPDGPVGYLFEMLGIDHSDFEIISTNSGISNSTVRAQNSINKAEPVVRKQSMNPFHFKLPSIKGEKFKLTASELHSISESLAQENEIIEKLLGKNFCDTSCKTASDYTTDDFTLDFNRVINPKHNHVNLSPKTLTHLKKLAQNTSTPPDVALEICDILLKYTPKAKQLRNLKIKLSKGI